MKSTVERQTTTSQNSTSTSPNKKSRYFDQLINLTHDYSTNRESDYNLNMKQLKKWARDKYNAINNMNEISLIERPKPKVKKSLETRLQVYKKEHKIKGHGMHIMKLPKLPYGIHQTYNEEKEFTKSHFISQSVDMSPEKHKEIEDLKRKYKLQSKQLGSFENRRRSLSPTLYANMSNYDTHNMKAGTLVCQKETYAFTAYEKEKQKFDQTTSSYHSAIKRRLSAQERAINSRLRKKKGVISNDVKNRLYASVSQDFSEYRSSSLLSKYSPLFEEECNLKVF